MSQMQISWVGRLTTKPRDHHALHHLGTLTRRKLSELSKENAQQSKKVRKSHSVRTLRNSQKKNKSSFSFAIFVSHFLSHIFLIFLSFIFCCFLTHVFLILFLFLSHIFLIFLLRKRVAQCVVCCHLAFVVFWLTFSSFFFAVFISHFPHFSLEKKSGAVCGALPPVMERAFVSLAALTAKILQEIEQHPTQQIPFFPLHNLTFENLNKCKQFALGGKSSSRSRSIQPNKYLLSFAQFDSWKLMWRKVEQMWTTCSSRREILLKIKQYPQIPFFLLHKFVSSLQLDLTLICRFIFVHRSILKSFNSLKC